MNQIGPNFQGLQSAGIVFGPIKTESPLCLRIRYVYVFSLLAKIFRGYCVGTGDDFGPENWEYTHPLWEASWEIFSRAVLEY